MGHVIAAEGPEIAYERGGNGPLLVLVHRTTADNTTGNSVQLALREGFRTLVAALDGAAGGGAHRPPRVAAHPR